MICLLDAEASMRSPALSDLKDEIHLLRGERVMLDSSLAQIHGVSTKRLNQQRRRNQKRFPADFAFRLTSEEFTSLKSQIVTSSYGGRRYLPWVFTEHGAIMLATVLNSDIAVNASVRVVRAFVQMRELVSANAVPAQRLAELENKSEGHDEAIAQLFHAIRSLIEPQPPKKREIGFHVKEAGAGYRITRRRKV